MGHAAALRKVRALKERELRARNQFLLQGLRLKNELDEFRLPSRTVSRRNRFAIPTGAAGAAAAVLAMGVQAALSTGQGTAEPISAATQQAGGDQEKSGTLSGTVTDAAGAVVAKAAITITNVATARRHPVEDRQRGAIRGERSAERQV